MKDEFARTDASQEAKRRQRVLWWAATVSIVVGIVAPIAATWFAITWGAKEQWRSPYIGLEPDWTLYAIFTVGIVASVALGIGGLVLVARGASWNQQSGVPGILPVLLGSVAFGLVVLADILAYAALSWYVRVP